MNLNEFFTVFEAFIGQRYGSRPLRETIPENEFREILQQAELIECNGVNLLTYCYELDENCIGDRHYQLKSKNELFQNFEVPFSALLLNFKCF